MATAAADEHTEAMEQVGGEERAAEAVEAMEQVEGEERAEEAKTEAAEAMEQGEGEGRAEGEADAPAEEGEADAPAEEGAEASDEGHVEATEQVEEEEVQAEAEGEEDVQAEAEEEVQAEAAEEAEALSTVLPLGRVKKIMRVDRDIKKVTAEASLLIAAATELFLGSLAAGAHTSATQRGRRAVRAVDVRAAARAHGPTADFLLDSLPAFEEAPRAARSGSDGAVAAAGAAAPKPLPRGTRRIDGFFQKVT